MNIANLDTSNISEIRLYGLGGTNLNSLELIENHFKITLFSQDRSIDDDCCFFNDNRNKFITRKGTKRLILFSFNQKIYAHAIMIDDGKRKSRDPEYPCSYLLLKGSIDYFDEPIPHSEWGKIWNKQANQSAVIL